jgi:magnesium transporter
VVSTIEKYDLVAVLLLISIGRLVGQITVDDVMDRYVNSLNVIIIWLPDFLKDVETDENCVAANNRATSVATYRMLVV